MVCWLRVIFVWYLSISVVSAVKGISTTIETPLDCERLAIQPQMCYNNKIFSLEDKLNFRVMSNNSKQHSKHIHQLKKRLKNDLKFKKIRSKNACFSFFEQNL